MQESLEKRVFKLTQIFKANEKRPETVHSIYIAMKKYVPFEVFNSKVNSDFIKLEVDLYKHMRDLYKV